MNDALLADLRALADVFASASRAWHRANPTWYGEGRRDSYDHAEEEVRDLIAKHTPEPNGVIYKAGQEAAQDERERIAREIEKRYLGPDSGRHYDGREAADANLRNAYDEGLEVAARIARGES